MKKIIMMAALVLIITSCARKVKLTGELKAKLDEQQVNYRNIQFYNNGTFTLRQKNSFEAMVASNGKLRMKKRKESEKMKFKTGTKAACDTIIGETFYMRFEKGAGKLLPFRMSQTGLYELLPDRSDTSGNYVLYNGREYKIVSFREITLHAKSKKVHEAHKQIRKVKGITVKG